MGSRIYLAILTTIIMMAPAPLWAAKSSAALEKFTQAAEQNPEIIDQWVQYPDTYRQSMLTASEYPEVLGRLGRLQRKTRAQFQSLVRPLSQSEQRQVYEITRYPQLLESLAGPNTLSKNEIKKLTTAFPESVQKAALDVGRKKHGLLQQVQAMNQESEAEFNRNLVGIPPNAQESFRQLLKIPELLSSMEEHLPLSQAMGEAYRSDPVALQNQLASYESAVEAQNNDAVTSFESDLAENPQTAKELREAAQDYAQAEGYSVYEVDEPPSRTQVYVNINPYTYWFGYPWWYSYSYWRPYPYWWNLGFYFGPGWGIGFWGYPSYYYTNWFYGNYGNFYRYPYASSYYWRQYNNYRYRYGYGYGNRYRAGYRNGFYRGVDQWYNRRGRDYFSQGYVKDGKNPQRFRDYGARENRFHKDRSRQGPGQVQRADYFPRSRQGKENSRMGKGPSGDQPGNRNWDRSNQGKRGKNRGGEISNQPNRKVGDGSGNRRGGGQRDGLVDQARQGRKGTGSPEMGNTNRTNRRPGSKGGEAVSGKRGSGGSGEAVQSSRSRGRSNESAAPANREAVNSGGHNYGQRVSSPPASSSRSGSWGGSRSRGSWGGSRSSGGFGGSSRGSFGGGSRGSFGGGGRSRGR